MPIGKGLFSVDDYARFGKLVDDLERAGAYAISYYPKRGEVIAWCRERDLERIREAVYEDYDVLVQHVRGVIYMVRVHW